MKILKLSSLALVALTFVVFFACKKSISDPSVTSAAGKAGKMSTPTLTAVDAGEAYITLRVCAGATGAPAGFSIQWMTAEAYAANGNQWYASDDPRLCKASFSGNAKDSRYLLGANACVEVTIGDLLMDNGASAFNCGVDGLECGTTYIFRAFAHANSTLQRSDFTDNYSTPTANCGTATCGRHHFGYWKHIDKFVTAVGISDPSVTDPLYLSATPTFMQLGTVWYSEAQIFQILNTPGSGNGLIILAHQLISSKLSGIDGIADPNVAAADAAIGGSNVLTGTKPASFQATLSGVLNRANNCKL